MKKTVIAFTAALMVTVLSACQNGNAAGSRTGVGSTTNANANASAATISTDVSIVQDLFPGLEGIESTEFEVIKHGGDDDPRSLPGPTSYVYQGYMVLTEEAANDLAEAYEWQDFETSVTFEAVTERSGDYKLDGQFTKDVLKSTYSGRTWFDETNKTILFTVQTL